MYPHLSRYYSFIDFDFLKAPGGASIAANTLKTFINAGIKHKVIAIFDYDTAAQVSLNSLKSVAIPANYRVVQYPWLELAANYPTIGPTGEMYMDVNKIACGLELYLGQDVLSEQNKFTPIQWTGYEKSVKKYQGEILSKGIVQDKFRRKLERCQQDQSCIQQYDWSGIRAILNLIFNAFN